MLEIFHSRGQRLTLFFRQEFLKLPCEQCGALTKNLPNNNNIVDDDDDDDDVVVIVINNNNKQWEKHSHLLGI